MPQYPSNPPGGGGANTSTYYSGTSMNFGSYAYIALSEIIDNFIASYIGTGKLLEGTLKGDVHYHAHRALQELSYDTLKSWKSLEVEVCPSLRVPIPHDYVNYVKLAWVDSDGIERILYPTGKTSYPTTVYQDMDNCVDGDDGTASSYVDASTLTAANLTEYTGAGPYSDADYKFNGNQKHGLAEQTIPDSWASYKGSSSSSVAIDSSLTANASVDNDSYFDNAGKRYGLDPQYAQSNGSYFIDLENGMINFSSNVSGKTIVLKYISDGHATNDEIIVPKLAEEAVYKWIAYGCLIAKTGIAENVIQRFKKEKFAETRKAKIRLSNIKIEEITQIMRGKSKFIKH